MIDFLFSMSFHKAKQKLGMDVYEVWQLKFWKNSKMKKKSECVMFHTFGCHIFTWSWISIYVYFVVVDQFSSSCQWKTQITRLSKLNSMTYKSMFSSWKCVANSPVVTIKKTHAKLDIIAIPPFFLAWTKKRIFKLLCNEAWYFTLSRSREGIEVSNIRLL